MRLWCAICKSASPLRGVCDRNESLSVPFYEVWVYVIADAARVLQIPRCLCPRAAGHVVGTEDSEEPFAREEAGLAWRRLGAV